MFFFRCSERFRFLPLVLRFIGSSQGIIPLAMPCKQTIALMCSSLPSLLQLFEKVFWAHPESLTKQIYYQFEFKTSKGLQSKEIYFDSSSELGGLF